MVRDVENHEKIADPSDVSMAYSGRSQLDEDDWSFPASPSEERTFAEQKSAVNRKGCIIGAVGLPMDQEAPKNQQIFEASATQVQSTSEDIVLER